MTFRDKYKLPIIFRNIIRDLESDQDSNFIETYRDPYNSWRIVFNKKFTNHAGYDSIDSYLEAIFDILNNGESYFEAACTERTNQVIYLKNNSIF